MRLCKPEWVHHDEKPIFSIDIHPDGKKFATGGQGNDSGRVVIWNLGPVVDEKLEDDKSVPKILCQLDNHLACVNTVRWSCSGTMLASGGDDKIIMLWKRSKAPSNVFGSTGITKSLENWRSNTTLRGHSGDILDLAWSPGDRWLASCSIDNTVIVWDMHNTPAMVTTLKGHTGLVKGVTWDPVGKYLASQSDDRSVRIWLTNDWSCQTTITEPFEGCGGTTHVLRLSWSPDGQYLVSAHAMNGGGPTAQIIEREGWTCENDFVGHRKAVTCVRFNQSILKRHKPNKNKSQQFCCLAIGSRDHSVSVWATALQRPVVVVHELFQDTVLDLSWSNDRHILLACSTDGTVACIIFSEEELGSMLSEDDKNSLYQRIYGKSAVTDMNDSHTGKDMLIEYAELLDVNDRSQSKFDNSSNHEHADNDVEMISKNADDFRPPSQTSTPTKAISQQIETRRPDGRRRITPMFIPLTEEGCDVTTELSSSSRSKPNTNVEKKMNEQMNRVGVSSNALSRTDEESKIKDLYAKQSNSIKQPMNNGHLDHRLTKAVPLKANLIKSPQLQIQTAQTEVNKVPPDPMNRINFLKAGKASPFKQAVIKQHGDYVVKAVNNNASTTFGPLCKVECAFGKHQRNTLWEMYVGSPVVNFSLSAKYVLICSQDGTIRFVDIKNGILTLPVIKLFSPAILSVFSINCELGGVVTECGTIRIWNLTEQTIFLTTTCNELLNAGGTTSFVTYFHVTEAGVPFILLSNDCSFSYCKKLDSWITLNSRDPIMRHGISTLPHNHSKNVKTFPLASVQSTSHVFPTIPQTTQDQSNNNWQNTAKLTFIENQIKICESINSPVELELWYTHLGLHLANHGPEKRIRILLDDLLGVPFVFALIPPATERQRKNAILGIDKRKLLLNVLEQLKSVPKWQRIYMEYSQQLKDINANQGQLEINCTTNVKID